MVKKFISLVTGSHRVSTSRHTHTHTHNCHGNNADPIRLLKELRQRKSSNVDAEDQKKKKKQTGKPETTTSQRRHRRNELDTTKKTYWRNWRKKMKIESTRQ